MTSKQRKKCHQCSTKNEANESIKNTLTVQQYDIDFSSDPTRTHKINAKKLKLGCHLP